MLGTLNGALEVRKVSLEADAMGAEARGINELQDGIPVLTRIEIHYTLRVPTSARAVLDRALSSHQDKCPTANSLKGAVEVTWTADVEEVADR